MASPEDNLITVFTNKEITTLYKSFFEIIEDLKVDHNTLMKKINDKNGHEFASTIDYFTPEKYEQIRKKILDQGNECSRKILSFLEYFDSVINVKRVEEAAKNKRTTTKKIIINPLTSVE